MSKVRGTLAFAFVCLLPLSSRCDESPTPADSLVLEKFPVAKHGDLLLLPVTAFGKTYQFMLDTGSTCVIYDLSLPLGDPIGGIAVRSSKASTSQKTFQAPRANLGGIIFSSDPVLGLDLSKVREAGRPVYGVLGMDFLRHHVVRIDFDEGAVEILKGLPKDPGVPVELTKDRQGCPACYVQIEGAVRVPFQVDTGCIGCDMAASPEFNLALSRKKLKILNSDFSEGSFDGTAPSRMGQADAMTVGGLRIVGPILAESSPEFGGRLGNSFLSRFQVIFDFPSNRMYLRKGKEFDRVDGWRNLSGIQLGSEGGRIFVDSVENGSAAANAGLRKGDVLSKIDRRNPNRMSPFELSRVFQNPGQIEIAVIRGKDAIEVTLMLKR
jgi:PDZ domain